MTKPSAKLPLEQQEIRAKCFHPGRPFIEFPSAETAQSIPARFKQMVQKFSQRVAVKSRNQSLNYNELNIAANLLAHAILVYRGSGQEPIGILLAKGAPLVVAVFGVLKAGKMYVLLDPSHPTARNRLILEHSQASVIITDAEHLAVARGLARQGDRIINLTEVDSCVNSHDPDVVISPDAIAWIHYTSGSTGEPKGVIQSHRNALYKVMHDTNDYHVCAADRLTFPASRGGDMFLALLNGASVFPVEIKEDGFTGFANCLNRDEVTILTSVTSTFRHFVSSLANGQKFTNVRLIRLIGEPLYKNDVDLFKRHFSEECILLNRLGSNETGNFCQYFIDHSTPLADGVVPVGYPVEGKEVFLLDDEGNHVGENQVGEFAVVNRHLAVGYWRNAELTEAAFKSDSSGGDTRIYRVGDLGRRLPSGCFVHLGRKDFQVKVRGNRVEIAEVEAALLSCANIKDVAVVGREDASGETRLIAYFVAGGAPVPTSVEIRQALVAKLPAYMIPAVYVAMDGLPVTGIGKVDRRALPEPTLEEIEVHAEYAAPRDETERILCRIWTEILGVSQVGIDDDFFTMGGHSLLATKMFARLDEVFGRSVLLGVLTSSPTVRLLAKHYNTPVPAGRRTALVPLTKQGPLPPIYAVPGIFGNVVGYTELARALGVDQPFYALQSIGLDGKDTPIFSVNEMAKRYVSEIRDMQSSGPYAIIGACFGATVAYEMARQLLEDGAEVAFLGVLDPSRRERPRIGVGSLPRIRAINRFKAFSDLATDRLRIYLKELLSLEDGGRAKFIVTKIRDLLYRTRDKKFKSVQRELHQLEVYRANRLALRHYRRKPLRGGLRAFEIFESSHPRNAATRSFRWETLWHGVSSRHRVPGKDSGDMLVGENVRVLAKLLKERLRVAFAGDTDHDKEREIHR